MDIKIVNNAKDATGIAVIIDVFRAFTVEAYLMHNGAEKLVPIGDMQLAYDYKKNNDNYILIGERNGEMLPGFNFGNSPSQIKNIDFSGKTIFHTTSCGTQGIVGAINADEILTGALVNSEAIAQYIKEKNPKEVSLVAMMGSNGKPPFDEDILCAEYIKSLLENKPLTDLNDKIENLKLTSGAKFFNKSYQHIFPEMDFYLCTEINKFSFVLKVNKDNNDLAYMEKIETF